MFTGDDSIPSVCSGVTLAAEPHAVGEDYAQDAIEELQLALAEARAQGKNLEPVYRIWQLKQKVYSGIRRDLSFDLWTGARL